MGRIVRVGVTFPSELLSELDRTAKDMGYKSRSKAIHDSVRAFLNEYAWLADVKGMKAGSITMKYDHDTRELESDLTETQHLFESVICASMHVHLSKDKCLETIAVKGRADKIKLLVERLKARRGVEEVKINLFAIQQ